MYIKKIYISLLCIIILALACAGLASVLRKDDLKESTSLDKTELIDRTVVSRACAAKMLSLLCYKRDEIINMPAVSRYNDIGEGKWYDKYFNAMDSLGIVWGNDECRPLDNLTYAEAEGIFRYFMNKAGEAGVSGINSVPASWDYSESSGSMERSVSVDSLSVNTPEPNEYIGSDDWLHMYGSLLELKRDDGEPYYRAMNRERIFLMSLAESEESTWSIITDRGRFYFDGYAFDAYTNSSIDVLTDGNEIIYIFGQAEEPALIESALISDYSEDELTMFCHDVSIDLLVSEEVYNALRQNEAGSGEVDTKPLVADITIDNGIVTDVNIYNDRRKDKILSVSESEIETAGYGRMGYTSSCVVYGVYDELKVLSSGDIAVGYSLADIVVNSDGKVCAVLITEKLKPETIRVAIMTNGYKSLYHKKVTLTSDKGMTVSDGVNNYEYAAGESLKITPDNEMFIKGRINITPNDCGKIRINNLKRSYGRPKYRGNIELALYPEGIVIVNELSIEEYLYAVVPSEMPVAYGTEPLKAQAVCARSYAYMQIAGSKLGNIGAHVNDSTAFQVYNNSKETEESINAVNATAGRVLEFDGNIISTYYFSTSCGITSDGSDVWNGMKEVPYLMGSLQKAVAPKTTETAVSDQGLAVSGQNLEVNEDTGHGNYYNELPENENRPDLSKEKAMRKFMDNPPCETYDSSYPWYRWSVNISKTQLKRSVDASLKARYDANPLLILTKGEDGNYSSVPVETAGEIKSVKVTKRGKSGIAKEIIIKGTERTIKVISEYNVRMMLAPYDCVLTRQDDTTVTGLSLLPSAYMYIDTVKNSDNTEFVIKGGGYGHGAGMSQNGAKTMADMGYDYEGILMHYYPGSVVTASE